jgi:DNA polymerase elongation subunit (family B)
MSSKPVMGDAEPKQFTIDLARTIEDKLNNFYDVFAKKAFNCNAHKFHIKGESVARTGFWVVKKRYALDKVYDLETNQDVEKMVVKGLDVVRSSFPKAFREFMSGLLLDILRKVDKDIIDTKILEFKEVLKTLPFTEVARNTSANGVDKYSHAGSLNQFKGGTPAHIKAAITYNRLLKQFGIETRYEPISNGEKIKYVLMKPNPLKIEALAFKGYNDPKEITQMIHQYIDTDELFEKEIRNKLNDFYDALNWGNIPTEVNQHAEQFFSF